MVTELRDNSPPWRRRLHLPSYRVGEAARLACTMPQSIAYWHYGGGDPVFTEQKERGEPLSYLELVEVAFVATCRKEGMSLQRIRRSHDYLSRMFEEQHPFAVYRLETEGVHILKGLEGNEGKESDLIVADAAGQLLWRKFFLDQIHAFDYEDDLALRWHPRGRDVPIIVDPRIAFGAPTLEGIGIPTWVFKGRAAANEPIAEIAADFDVSELDVQQALQFEGVELPVG